MKIQCRATTKQQSAKLVETFSNGSVCITNDGQFETVLIPEWTDYGEKQMSTSGEIFKLELNKTYIIDIELEHDNTKVIE